MHTKCEHLIGEPYYHCMGIHHNAIGLAFFLTLMALMVIVPLIALKRMQFTEATD